MSGKKKSSKNKSGHKRHERRFFPRSAQAPWLVYATGGIGAALLGAGAWATAYGQAFDADPKLRAVPQYLIAAGALLSGAAIWFGSSSEAPLRVGDLGIGVERGEVRRMPWWAVERIAWDDAGALTVTGKDDAGTSMSIRVPLRAHPEAIADIVAEADARIPKVVELSDETRARLPAHAPHAGTVITLEALQIVGKRCAASGKIISYEPEGRVCTRCERVYLKTEVPKKCACGASLEALRGKAEADDENESETAEA